MWSASGPTRRCPLSGSVGMSVGQVSSKYMEESPLARGLVVSWALKAESEGKEVGSLAAAVLALGGGGGRRRAAKRLLYLQ